MLYTLFPVIAAALFVLKVAGLAPTMSWWWLTAPLAGLVILFITHVVVLTAIRMRSDDPWERHVRKYSGKER